MFALKKSAPDVFVYAPSPRPQDQLQPSTCRTFFEVVLSAGRTTRMAVM